MVREWVQVKLLRSTDAEDPSGVLELHRRSRRQPPAKVSAIVAGLLLVAGTLACVHWRTSWRIGWSGESPTTGLSLIGQGYVKLYGTDCVQPERLGNRSVQVGPNACQSACDFSPKCLGFEMYNGDSDCQMLSGCGGWSTDAVDTYAMVKEPAFFGLKEPMLKLPTGFEEPPPVPRPRPGQPTPSFPFMPVPLPSWPFGGGAGERTSEDKWPPPQLPTWSPSNGSDGGAGNERQKDPQEKGNGQSEKETAPRATADKHQKVTRDGAASVKDEVKAAADIMVRGKADFHPAGHRVAFSTDMYGQAGGAKHATKNQNVKVRKAGGHRAFNDTVSFYVYRAQSKADYPMENVNVADLPGVLWYLQEEVVTQCPRKYDISRVLRLKFTAKVGHGGAFIPFVAFDRGKCTVPSCGHLWKEFGFKVGCQRTGAGGCYGRERGHWFSLPGPCPDSAVGSKGHACRQAMPGGACRTLADLKAPGGKCSYHVEVDAEIPLGKLTGIADYEAFCRNGNLEYDKATDRGRGTSFWDGKRDKWKAAWRLQQARKYLSDAYPHTPAAFGHDRPRCIFSSPEPSCD